MKLSRSSSTASAGPADPPLPHAETRWPSSPRASPKPGDAGPRARTGALRLQALPAEIVDAIAARLAPADVLRLARAAQGSQMSPTLDRRAVASLATWRAAKDVDVAGIRESLAFIARLAAPLRADALEEVGHGLIVCEGEGRPAAVEAFREAVESLPHHLPERQALLAFERIARHDDPRAAVQAGEKIPAVAEAWGCDVQRLERMVIRAAGDDSIGRRAYRGHNVKQLADEVGISTPASLRALDRIAVYSRHPDSAGQRVRDGEDPADVARLTGIATPEGRQWLEQLAATA